MSMCMGKYDKMHDITEYQGTGFGHSHSPTELYVHVYIKSNNPLGLGSEIIENVLLSARFGFPKHGIRRSHGKNVIKCAFSMNEIPFPGKT